VVPHAVRRANEVRASHFEPLGGIETLAALFRQANAHRPVILT
jgi:hypothetical protein